MISNDGLHFREPVKGHAYLSEDESPVTPAASAWYPTILEQANGILNVGDETRIYHGRWRNAARPDYYAEVALATLPRDRWGALGLFPGQTEGTVWSAPVTLPQGGCQVSLNADGTKDMRIEISDERFALLPDYSGPQSGAAVTGAMADGGLDCGVTWPEGNLAGLGGKRVRFRVHLKKTGGLDPRLYALYLKA